MAQIYTPAQGIEVVKYEGFEQLDQAKFRAGINAAFQKWGKKLNPDYFDTAQPKSVYIVGDYEAGAITTDLDGTTYLCKNFVHRLIRRGVYAA